MAARASLQQSVRNLFKPGNGSAPPFFAGREAETDELNYFGNAVAAGRSIESDVVLYGPRGNGKTVLLDRFCGRCRRLMPEEGLVAAAPASRLRSAADIREELFPTGFVRELGRRLADAESVGVGPVRVDLGDSSDSRLVDILRARLEKGPLVLAVDEAHTLSPDLGHELLNESQALRTEGLPFLLVLAGTPDIEQHLRSMQASFWDRSERIAVGLLHEKEALRALDDPLDRLGIGFSEGASKIASEDICRYPYFTQLWGKCLAVAKKDFDERPMVSAADAAKASASFARRRNVFYRGRYDELVDSGMLGPAEAVARAFSSDSIATRKDLLKVVGAALSEEGQREEAASARTKEAADHLARIGFVWQREGPMEAGIPSLMDHVLRQAATP